MEVRYAVFRFFFVSISNYRNDSNTFTNYFIMIQIQYFKNIWELHYDFALIFFFLISFVTFFRVSDFFIFMPITIVSDSS